MAASIKLVRNLLYTAFPPGIFVLPVTILSTGRSSELDGCQWFRDRDGYRSASQLITAIGDSAPAGKVYQEGAEIGRPTYPSINNCL